MEYSHLADTRFPNFDTVDPYAFKNTFEYTRWVPGTKIHMVNVLWNSDYSNVVKFSDDAARDAWFDSITDSYVTELTTNARIVPDGSAKLPLPYDVAACYNYLYVDIPIATSADQMIEDETTAGVRRWFFFVGDVDYSAPNTTLVSLQLDIWTTYVNSATINYMMLERGHAPVAATDTDTYFQNPRENSSLLLAPDVNYGDPKSDYNASAALIPYGRGEKVVCMATTFSQSDLASLGWLANGVTGSGFSNPTFSDTSDWYGYQLQVSGFEYDTTSGFDSMRAKASYGSFTSDASNDAFNSTCTLGVAGSDFPSFIADVREHCPALMRGIVALFVCPADALVSLGSYAWHDHVVTRYSAQTNPTASSVSVAKSGFGYTTEQERFAKLYTYPYAYLTVCDDNGKELTVYIESLTTNALQCKILTDVLYPTLNYRMILMNVQGNNTPSVVWRNVTSADTTSVPVIATPWECVFEMQLPTYELYMDADLAYKLDSYASWQNGRDQALASYHNSVRSANNAYTNAVASADTAQTNSNASATTAQTNSNASATTAQTNSNASATTAQTNSNASATTARNNTNNATNAMSANVDITIAANTANMTSANHAATQTVNMQGGTSQRNTTSTNVINAITTNEEQQVSVSTTDASGVASTASAAGSGIASAAGAAATGNLAGAVGAIIGIAGSATSALVASSNARLVAQAKTELMTLANNSNTTINDNNVDASQNVTGYENTNRTEQTETNNEALDGQRDNNVSMQNTNATNAYNTQTANAGRTYSTSVANAGRTYSTSVANAKRTYDTSVSNASNTHTTSTANATRSRQVSVLNAQESLRATQDGTAAGYSDSKRKGPLALTSGNSKFTWDTRRNALYVRRMTQSKSAIAQTASQFARFGYNLNQVWNVTSLTLMKHFTYWKASDIWIDVRNQSSADVADTLALMFRTGLTVWSEPTEIGKVNIYDN